MRSQLIFLLLITSILPMYGQEQSWTLEQCVKYGLAHNLRVQQAGVQHELSEIARKQSYNELFPAISGSTNAGRSYGRSIDPNTNTYINTSFFNNYYSLNAYLPVFNGGELIGRIRQAKFASDAAGYQLAYTEEMTAFAIMAAFYDAVFYSELLEITKEQQQLSDQVVQRTEAMIRAGVKSQADLLEARANRERDALLMVQASNNLDLAQETLKRAMNLVRPGHLALVKPGMQESAQPVSSGYEALRDRFLQTSPFIKSHEAAWEVEKTNVRIARSALFPSIGLAANANTGFYETYKDDKGQIIPFGKQLENNQRQFLGLALDIPIFSRFRNRTAINRSKLLAGDARLRLDQAKADIQFEVEQNYLLLRAALQETEQAARQLEADELAYEAASKKYNEGLISVFDLNMAKNRLANTRAQLLKAQLTYEAKRRTLAYYEGTKFWEL